MIEFAQNLVLLPMKGDGGRDIEGEAKAQSASGPAPSEIDLDELTTRLKALAAKARQSPPARATRKDLAVIAVAIVLSITSGAVTAQYLIPGHPHAPAAPSKSLAHATGSVAVAIGNGAR